jgi:HEAT repeat protein
VVDGAHTAGKFAVEKWETVSSHVVAHKTLAHDLSALSLIFGLIALCVQLFLTSRVLRQFGIVHTMMMYFAGFFATATAFIFNGSLINLVRGYEHGFHSLFLSGYHITFYSTFKKYREFLRVFLEGILTPIAIIFSVGIITIIFDERFGNVLPYVMTTIAGGLILITFFMRKSFTKISAENFQNAPNLAEKILATEMLGHRGHIGATKVLSRSLLDKTQHPILREKVIHTLTDLDDPSVVHTYIKILKDPEESLDIKIYVLDSLLKFKSLQDYCASKAFTQHQMMQVLKNLFENTDHGHLKKLLIMNIFRHLPLSKTVRFLQDTLKSANEKLQSICLRSCRMFDDPEIINYLEPYLQHESPRVRSHCVIALWKVGDREKLWEILELMLTEKNPEILVSGIYAAGEIGQPRGMEKISQHLQHEHPEVRLHSLLALGKMGNNKALPGLLEIFLGEDRDLARRAYEMSKRLPYQLREKLERQLHHAIAKKVLDVLAQENVHSHEHLKNLSEEKLDFLKRMYRLAGKYEHLCALEKLSS